MERNHQEITEAFLEDGPMPLELWNSLHDSWRVGDYDSDEEKEEEKEEENSPPIPIWEEKKKKRKREEKEKKEKMTKEIKRARTRATKDEKKRLKGRQGRSKENREKARERAKINSVLVVDFSFGECVICGQTSEWIEDYHTGDVICGECGNVESTKGLGMSSTFNHRIRVKSKPYQKVVHFRQRMAQLLGTDPKIRDDIWERLEKMIKTLFSPKQVEFMGKKTFSLAIKMLSTKYTKEDFKKMNAPKGVRKLNEEFLSQNFPPIKRLSANWIQARRRLSLDELPCEVTDLGLLYDRLCARYSCVAHVFQEKLFSSAGEKSKENQLERRNILNVNYVTLQILRLESPEVWMHWAKYFPQLVAKKQPEKNNRRWKTIIETCKVRYPFYSNPRTEEKLFLHWEYIEFTREEINKYCNYFD